MKRLFSLLRSLLSGLRGKLTLTYTLVTVLALLALEMFLFFSAFLISSLTNTDLRDYLTDVIYYLYPDAQEYLQPGQEDLQGLQAWLEQVHARGYASVEPQYAFDSPAALIVQSEPMYVLSPDGVVLAQSPAGRDSRVGQHYNLADIPGGSDLFRHALEGGYDSMKLASITAERNYLMAVPVMQGDRPSEVVGVILLTIRRPPSMLLQVLPTMLGWVLATGIILLMLVAPFGALFGFIMSRGLTTRLNRLASAVDAWSEGDFGPRPVDRSKDEIGYLSMRMRNMAERVQNLLQTQQQLAMIEERNRLARDLHDTVKQQTFATLMQVRAARNLIGQDPEAARQRLEEAESLIKTSQQDLGLIIAELRPAALDGQGLAGALRDYLDTWNRHSRILGTLNVVNERALPLDLEQTLYRVAQEALSNVARHSRASSVTVRLAYEPDKVCLSVIDNGVGFDPAEHSSGYGLQSMRERLSAAGGYLTIEGEAGEGTVLKAVVPVKTRSFKDDRANHSPAGR
ncbi:MAG: HAMP domain-containing protein [Chloroflexi bacterium]|nr:HAMP domain-containing protein [Chloroflexota bacterium]